MSNEFTPPEALQMLMSDLDFLALAGEGQKPCFKGRYYVDYNSWIGTFLRMKDNEQVDNGIVIINSIISNLTEQYKLYKISQFNDVLIDKVKNARDGLVRISDTYKRIGKSLYSGKIQNGAILTMNNIIKTSTQISDSISQPIPISTLSRLSKDENLVQIGSSLDSISFSYKSALTET